MMTSGQRQQRFPTRSGVRRRGDEYQDSVALDLMVDWLEHTDRYQWMQVEADDRGALDDVVALDTRNVLHVWQVKHATHPDIPEDAYTWDSLLAQSEGRRGRTTQSLLQKWARSLERLQREYTEVDACVTSNRSAAPDLQAALFPYGLVDFDAITDEQTRHVIASQLGGETQARAFFTQFHFRLNRPNLDELLDGARVRFQQLGGTNDGWSNLKEEVADWVNFKDIPTPGGYIRLQDIKDAAYWHKLEPLPQEFALPRDYVLPSRAFHSNLVNRILALPQGCLVLTAGPGSGKSTYASYLYRHFQRQGIPAVRHHYFLSLDEPFSTLRLEHARAAESLMADLDRHHAQALGAIASRNPRPDELGKWVATCGAYYAARDSALVVIIDGLDHVWREYRQIEELQELLKFLLPAAQGVVVLLVTQPLDESLLPPLVGRAAPPSTWLNLPILDQEAVHTWLHRHRRELELPEASFEYALERLSKAMYDKSHGHPLHLRYTYVAMQEQHLAMTPETVRALPGCAHADITAYYEELWRAVPEESRRILCLLAACPFSWPRAGILDCLDPQGDQRSDLISALRQVRHLLRQDSLGLRPFHSSLLQFLRAQPSYRDYATSVSRKALVWLQTAGPEHLLWAYEWLLEAQLGNEQPLRDGPTRHWGVEASARRRPNEEVETILSQCLSLALWAQDLSQRIPQEHRLHRSAHVAPVVRVLALLHNYATESLVDQCLRNRDGGYAEIMLGVLGASLLRRKDVSRMRGLLKPAVLTSLAGAERAIVLRASVLLALEEGIPLSEDLSQADYGDDPFVALYWVLREHGGTSGLAIRFPDARLLQMQSTEVYEKQGEVQTCMYQAFFCFLANELLGVGERNSAWLQGVESQGWHLLFLRRLATIAKELAPYLLEGRPFGFGRFYELLAVLPFTPGRPFETEWNYSRAALEVIPTIGLDIYLIANAGGNIPPIMPEGVLPLLESEYGELEAWLRIYACRGRPWLHDDALTMLIQEQHDSNASERRSFEEHARGYAALASVTALHRRSVQTQDALMQAGEYMIAHGYHKDLLFFSVLESIQAYHQHICSMPSGDSAGCVCAHWVSSLVPAVSRIRDYTDGDETRYAPEKLAEVLSEISPDALLNCYQWQRRYGEKKDALTTLHAFLNVADLDDPTHRTLAEEAIDSLSRSILQRRKRDATRVSRDSPGETDVPSEFQQEIPPSTPGQEDHPAFNVEQPKGLPRPVSYPPSRFEDYLQALRRKLMSYDKASVKSWIAYWSQKGRQVEVYHAVVQEIERGRYLDVYDEMVELASTLYGWEHAYGWLVKAQAESYGWWKYFSSEEDAPRRWAMVRERYPERWYDFIRDSLEEAGKRSRGGVVLSHYMWVRLIQYLLVVQQPAQAKRLIEVMVTDSLALVPFQSVESSAGVES